MTEPCASTSTRSGVQCEKQDGHAGPHVHGIDQRANGITVWGIDRTGG